MRRDRFATTSRVAAVATAAFFAHACASSTLIQSQPSGAKLFLDGERVGTTPYTMTDTKIVGSVTTVRLEQAGYEATTGSISRNEEFDVGACFGGVFLLFPFLWIEGYKPTHTFDLRPTAGAPALNAPPAGQPPPPPPSPVPPSPAPPAS